MLNPIPPYISIIFSLFTIGLFIATLRGLTYALKAKGLPAQKTVLYTGLGIGAWLTVIGILSYQGFFLDFSLPPRIGFVLISAFLAIIWVGTSKRIRPLILEIPPTWIHHLQAFRIGIEFILLALFLEEIIPVQMTFEGYNFDILSGIFGPIIAWFCFQKKSWSKNIAIAYNFIGIGLLFTILTIALLSTPFPFRTFMNEPVNTMPAYFPMIWLPGFVAPYAVFLHVLALVQLFSVSKD